MRRAPDFCRSIATWVCSAAAIGSLVFSGSAGAAPDARVIVKLKAEAASSGDERSSERVGALSVRQGVPFTAQRALGNRVRLVRAAGVSSAALARQLAADPDVAYAVPDRRMRPHATPNDTLYPFRGGGSPEQGQWYLRRPDANLVSAIDAERAWDTSKGAGVVVAVLDTGVLFDHPDLKRASDDGKLLPGYDFIRREAVANDGDGRDDDAADPGDWVTREDVDRSANDDLTDECLGPNEGIASDWHGTKVAGILGALTDNDRGIAGVGWDVKILPVRVLGKCGGFASDIGLAMRWAAGLPVEGVPTIPAANKAQILNLSLGGVGQCADDYADAIAEVVAAGVTVVVSAGNSDGRAVSEPANCEGVIAVAGLRHTGTKVGFSDLGEEVSISAPGGNCDTADGTQPCLYPLVSADNTGTTVPASDTYSDGRPDTAIFGTSFSAPLVAGAAALAIAIQPRMTPAEVRSLLQRTARPFPDDGAAAGTLQCQEPGNVSQLECYCTTDTCGAGMLDARAAVEAAVGVIARISVGSFEPQSGQLLTLSAIDSPTTGSRTLRSAVWSIRDGGGIVTGFTGAAAGASVTSNAVSVTPTANGRFTVQMTATDSAGASSSVERTIVIGAEGEEDDNDFGSGALGLGYLFALAAAALAVSSAVRRRANKHEDSDSSP